MTKIFIATDYTDYFLNAILFIKASVKSVVINLK